MRMRRLPIVAMMVLGTSAVQPQSVRVLASRREVRVIFPRDTARSWGWSAAQALPSLPTYSWAISVYGMDGTRILELTAIARDKRERHWSSLSTLVASALAGECKPGMWSVCDTAGMTASVHDGQVILVLHDSARIDRLFGLRPRFVDTWVLAPGRSGVPPHDSVAVEYFDPPIAPPDSARRAESARSQRRYEESIHLTYRSIEAGEYGTAPIRLTPGDSVAVHVSETRCTFDVCSERRSSTSDSGWNVVDTTVARLRAVAPDAGTSGILHGRPGDRIFVYGVRPGRTTIRVHGVHSSLDTAVSVRPPARELERAIVVTPPIADVRISPRPRRADTRGLHVDTIRTPVRQ